MLDYATIQPYVAAGLVSEQRHPDAPALRIFNYTKRATYEKAWDEVTMGCRGLILNIETEETIAKCIKKFWNVGEHIAKDLPFPNEIPIITEKLDGWYGSLYWLHDKPWIATRGSFTSPGAVWATQWFRSLPLKDYDDFRNPDVTHIFEIISPVTPIVVRYNYEGLVHLATIDKATGKDVWPVPLLPYIYYPRLINPLETDLQALTARDNSNEEGYVLRYPTSGLRLKCKFKTYVALHKVITGLSVKGIWELLRDGAGITAVCEGLPAEWVDWFDARKNELIKNYNAIAVQMFDDWKALNTGWLRHGYAKVTHRKEMALEILKTTYPHLLFAQLDGKTYDQQIWKLIEPKGKHVYRDEENG